MNEQEVSHTKAMEALKYELALEKSRHKMVTVAEKGVKDADKIHTSNGLEGQHESFHERRRGLEENAVKQNTETQSCTSQEVEDQQRLSKEKEGQTTPTKRKASKANKVCQQRPENLNYHIDHLPPIHSVRSNPSTSSLHMSTSTLGRPC